MGFWPIGAHAGSYMYLYYNVVYSQTRCSFVRNYVSNICCDTVFQCLEYLVAWWDEMTVFSSVKQFTLKCNFQFKFSRASCQVWIEFQLTSSGVHCCLQNVIPLCPKEREWSELHASPHIHIWIGHNHIWIYMDKTIWECALYVG